MVEIAMKNKTIPDFIRNLIFVVFPLCCPLVVSAETEKKTSSDENLINLADMPSNFVLETKKIEVPGYPLAFNPSIIRWQGSLLMSFRILPDRKRKFEARIGLAFLDENFNVIGEPQLLETAEPSSNIAARTDDARLVIINNQLWLVYSDNKEPTISKKGFRVYISQLISDGLKFSLLDPECLTTFEGESPHLREKNWGPFDYQGHLFLTYSLVPHRIFYPIPKSSTCITIAETKNNMHHQWQWGMPRGGTPGLLDNGQYLSFFHSSMDMESVQSKGKTSLHYFMGAYLFSSTPPFQITHMSSKPIIGKGFYENDCYIPYWKPVTVVYPCGFLSDEKYIWVFYGQHDNECWMAKLDKQALMDSLIPVETY